MEAEIIDIIASNIGCEAQHIQPHERMRDIADSLAWKEMIWELEDAIGRRISEEDEERLWRGTVGEMVAWCVGVRK